MSAHTSIVVVDTKIELNSHVDACFVGDHCLIVHDHKPVNIYGYDPKAGSKHAYVVDVAAAYIIPETGQVVIPSLHNAVFCEW